MKSTYTFAAVCVLLSGRVLAAPQDPGPVVSGLATCICDNEIFSLQDLTDSLEEAVKRALIPPMGNGDELQFPWCTRYPEFAEFPLLKPTFSSGAPGAYRLIYDYIGQKICGCVKHLPVSTSDTDFGLCVHEGDEPPSIIKSQPLKPENPLNPDPNNPLPPPNPISPLLPPPLVPGL